MCGFVLCGNWPGVWSCASVLGHAGNRKVDYSHVLIWFSCIDCVFRRVSPNTDQETLNGMISGLSSSTLGTG